MCTGCPRDKQILAEYTSSEKSLEVKVVARHCPRRHYESDRRRGCIELLLKSAARESYSNDFLKTKWLPRPVGFDRNLRQHVYSIDLPLHAFTCACVGVCITEHVCIQLLLLKRTVAMNNM